MDQELIAYLDERFSSIDERFRETSQQISSLREETAQQIGSLRDETVQQIGSLRDETAQQIGSLRDEFGSFRSEFGSLRDEFGSFRSEFGSLRSEFESFREETTQNFGRVDEGIRQVHVVIEGLRNGEVRVVSEGVSGFKEQLSDFRTEVSREFNDVRGLVGSTYTELDRRIRPLEMRKVRKS
jgi:archaellum component FlaC